MKLHTGRLKVARTSRCRADPVLQAYRSSIVNPKAWPRRHCACLHDLAATPDEGSSQPLRGIRRPSSFGLSPLDGVAAPSLGDGGVNSTRPPERGRPPCGLSRLEVLLAVDPRAQCSILHAKMLGEKFWAAQLTGSIDEHPLAERVHDSLPATIMPHSGQH